MIKLQFSDSRDSNMNAGCQRIVLLPKGGFEKYHYQEIRYIIGIWWNKDLPFNVETPYGTKLKR